ncbi:hypothetical protein MASR1M48_16960 [Lactococcus petauri]
MQVEGQEQKVYTGFTRASAGRLVFRRYKNRKIYCINQSCYVTLAEAGTLIKESPDFDVDGMDKHDFLYSIVMDAEKNLPQSQKASEALLLEIISRGSLSAFAAKRS